jgi:hypothetical protein
VHPEHGFFAKSWLLLARSNFVTLDNSDIIFYDNASDKAIRYYEDFMHKMGIDTKEDTDLDSMSNNSISDLEELFTNLLESKLSTKH